jgi:hypothetical protein
VNKYQRADTFPSQSLNDNRTINSGGGMTELYIAFLIVVLLVSAIREAIDDSMLLLRSEPSTLDSSASSGDEFNIRV